MKTFFQRSLAISLFFVSTTLLNCGQATSGDSSSSAAADSSTSGIVAGSIGGALSNSSSGGSQAYMKFNMPSTFTASLSNSLSLLPKASASTFCPTFRTSGTGCAASGSSMWLTYDDCTFTGNAEWNGVQELSMSVGTPACGSFPKPAAGDILYRQFVQTSGASVPGQVTLTANKLAGTVDDASANLDNFDTQTIATINHGGYGAAVTFNGSDARSQLQIGHHIVVSGVYDHSVTGTVAVTETPGATSRTITGSVTTYHNLMRIVGTSVLNNLVHEDICCLPISGSITTSYEKGQNVNPTAGGALLVGLSETLTFTGCGTATFVNTSGVSSNVTLNRCF
jgi:hypothetical protein